MSLAEDWGIVDENTVAAREATETYLKLFESEGAEVANDWLNSWKENLVTTGDDLETFFQKWNDKTIHWRVVVAGGAAVGGSTTLTPGFASGGDWSGKGPIEVGELGPEFIFPKSHGGFAVVDASTTKLLKSMGISPRGGAYIPMLDPGDLGGPYIPLPPPPPTTPSAPPPSAPPPTTTPWSLPPGAGDVIDMYNAPSISLPEMASWNFLDLITGPSFPGMLMGVSLEEGAMMQFAERTGLRKKKGLEWWQLGKRAKLAQQMAAGLYPPEAFGTQATAARGPSPLDMLGNIAGRLIEGDAWQARTLANTYDTPWGQYIFGQGEFPGWDSFLGTGGSATPTPSGGRDWDRFYEITGVPIGLAGLSPNRPYTGMPHGDWGPVLSDYPWIQQIGDDRSRVGQWVTGMEEFGDGYLPPDFALPGVYDTLPTEMLSELLQRGDKNFESDYLDPLGFDQPAPSVWKPPHGGARGSLTSGTSAPPPPQPPIVISSPPQIEEPSERVPSLAPIIAAVSQSSTQLGQALVTTMSSGKATEEIARAGSDNAQLQILQRIAAAVEKQPDADQLRDIMRESQDTSGF
jgi:hypothetical protein